MSPVPLPLLPTRRPVPPASPCPCLGPGHPLLLALLALLALSSLVLATLAIYLSGTWHWAGWGEGELWGAKLPTLSTSPSSPCSPAEPVGAGTGPVAGEPGGRRAPATGSQQAALGSPQHQCPAWWAPLSCPWPHHGLWAATGRGTEGQEGGSGAALPAETAQHCPWGTGEILAPAPERKKLGCKDLHPPQ